MFPYTHYKGCEYANITGLMMFRYTALGYANVLTWFVHVVQNKSHVYIDKQGVSLMVSIQLVCSNGA